MARATTRTLLSLDRFAQICGIHPLHFNQVEIHELAPSFTCESPYVQYAWQTADRVGREEIAQAIAEAESIFELHLGYAVAPKWYVSERLSFSRPWQPELSLLNTSNIRGHGQSLRVKHGEVISGGTENKTLIEAGVALTYSDADSDSYEETVTCSVTVGSGMAADEVAVYHPGESGDDAYEIRPIRVSISGTTATITMRREQLVKVALQEGLLAQAVDGLNDANFETTVDVYRHFNDRELQIEFLWERSPGECGCAEDDCANCGLVKQRGDFHLRDSRLGLIVPRASTWDADTECFTPTSLSIGRHPDHARLWYYAGLYDLASATPGTTMKDDYARAVTYLALTLLDRPLCACNAMQNFTKRWTEDLSKTVSTPSVSTSYRLSQRWLDNPIGTTVGAIHAWRLIQRSKVGDA